MFPVPSAQQGVGKNILCNPMKSAQHEAATLSTMSFTRARARTPYTAAD